MSILSKFFGFFTAKPATSPSPQAAQPSRKNITARRRRAGRASQFPWLDEAMAGIKRPGSYIVHPPKGEDLATSQTRVCARLQSRFGSGKYSTKRMRLEDGSGVIAVYIPARR